MKHLLFFALFASTLASAAPREIDEYHWEGVERIVAIGDIHGDYDQYLATLQAAGLVNSRGKWSGGATHLVQTGDIPDRGPDTNRIIRHLGKLVKEAKKKGGRVHPLLGNHEVMNVQGDLRYVSEGEYQAFVTKNSGALRDRYFALAMQELENRDPEKFAGLGENFREEWNRDYPLGWVEHRQAWSPQWNPDGEFANWALGLKVAVQINDLLFLHGGISGFYCQDSLASLTERARAALRSADAQDRRVIEDEFGPLWYRGLAGGVPPASLETVQAVLDRHAAKHIVVGHTPTPGVVWPGFDQRVIQADVGISAAHGGNVGYLEVNPEGLFAGYREGRLKLPARDDERLDYLRQVAAMHPGNSALAAMLAGLQAPAAAAGEPAGDGGEAATDAGGAPPASAQLIPTCGISG